MFVGMKEEIMEEKPIFITPEMISLLSRIQVKPSIQDKLLEVIQDRSASEINAILLYLGRFPDLRIIDRTLSDFLDQLKDRKT